MTAELIPPPEFDHPLPGDLSRAQLALLWLDVLEASDQMLLAGLQATLPPGADVRAAYQRWYDQYSREHFEMLERMATRFNQAQADHGRLGSPQDS